MLNDIYQRLLNSAKFVSVDVAEAIETIVNRVTTAEDGALFVVPHSERAAPPQYATGGHRQRVASQFLTVVVLRQHDDPKGSARALRFDALKDDVEQVLAGWSPADGSDPISLAAGESLGLANGVSLFVQTWQTSRYLFGATT